MKQEKAIQVNKRVAFRYLSLCAKEISFPDRMKLVKEHEGLVKDLEHLEKRYDMDKISDVSLAQEVKNEIEKKQDRIKKILEELSF